MLGRYLEQRINIYGRMLGPEIYTNQRRSQELRKGGTMLLAGDSMHSGPLWGLETCPPRKLSWTYVRACEATLS